MKLVRSSTPSLQSLASLTLIIFNLFAFAPWALADDSTVTISAGEFQRLVYSAHLHTQLAEKPQLDASLQVLLELQRRNPHLAPAALAGVLQEATARYWTNAPAGIRTNGSRDEILAAYLDVMRAVPKPTGFVPADLALLNVLTTRADAPGNRSQADLIHSGSQALLSGENDAAERRALVEACIARAQGSAAFATALDSLMAPEILCTLRDPPSVIIGNTNSALHGNVTMMSLLALSGADGSVTVTSNYVKGLFEEEVKTLWEIVHTNLALTVEFNQCQPDLAVYPTNQDAAYWEERKAAVRQARQIASSTAAVLLQSQLTAAPESSFKMPEWVGPVADTLGGLASVAASGDPGALISSIPGLIGLFDDSESPDEQIAREIGNIKTMIGDLSTNMNYRFDRVDQSLTTIFATLNTQMEKIEIIEGRTAHLTDSVDSIRRSLVDVQTSLYRIERNVAAYSADLLRSPVVGKMNNGLGYEKTAGSPMAYDNYNPNYVVMATDFYTYGCDTADDSAMALDFPRLPFGPEHLSSQLSPNGATNVYAETLNYINRCLWSPEIGLQLPGFEHTPLLVNPQDWNTGAGAFLQLALENPTYFRSYDRPSSRPEHLDGIIARGSELTNFHRNLTFTGSAINWNLYTKLGDYYVTKLNAFSNKVAATEDYYASTNNNFALNTWRQWDIAAPRLTATNSSLVLATPRNLIAARVSHSLVLKAEGRVAGWGANNYGQITIPDAANGAISVAAGGSHSLALKADGRVVGWGWDAYGQATNSTILSNGVAIAAGIFHTLALKADGTVIGWGGNDYGQITIPADLSNVVAIAAGYYHSLALKADGKVVGWGNNNFGQATIPAGLSNVVAIAGGGLHSLALKTDGSVAGWGANHDGQAGIPTSATSEVVAIAAGYAHSLALKSDGRVVGWGYNAVGQVTIPSDATSGVVAIAAGEYHSVALKADGSVAGWGQNDKGQAIARGWVGSPRVRNHIAAGDAHSLALRADGTVSGWGRNNYNQTIVPTDLPNVVAIAAGYFHSLALKADGKVVGWGAGAAGTSGGENFAQATIANDLSNVVAVAAGGWHSLALKADGRVVGWGRNDFSQRTIPTTATNVVAIAAGARHSLALKANGTVVGWGWNQDGQTTIPSALVNVVAIAAGYNHSLALKTDGTVVVWGDNGGTFGNRTLPPGLTNVVAIAASAHSLALKADGTVIAWGWNDDGQANVPTGLTNVVAIAAGGEHSLAVQADGTVVGWGAGRPGTSGGYNYGQATIPTNVVDLAAWGERPPGLGNIPAASSPITAVTAGSAHSLALAADGSVVGWGLNVWSQTNVPQQARSGVKAVASGLGHSLALTTSGSVLGWGLNDFGQTNVPAIAQSGVVAISAGGKHNLALRTDGRVEAWGLNGSDQTNVPDDVQGKTVAIAAGGEHSLALAADGSVWAWGGNSSGQAVVPTEALSGVVGIAAGRYHSLALKSGTSGGRVIAWGLNTRGQANVPTAAQSGVVAIAAGINHSLALKADGRVVIWGSGPPAFLPPQGWSNIVAITAGDQHSLFLRVSRTSDTDSLQTLSFIPAQIPFRVGPLLRGANEYLVAELGRSGDLRSAGTELSGAKALITAVLELGMPYTLEHDNVLRGFLYGSESLLDRDGSQSWLQAENARLQATPSSAPSLLSEVAALRHQRFTNELSQCLTNLHATRQPEIPRLVGHTLRLLNLLRDAWTTVPPPALETWSETNSPRVVLYGEPYAHYNLQYSDNLTAPAWSPVIMPGLQLQTNVHSGQVVPPPVSSGPQRFYRAVLPVP